MNPPFPLDEMLTAAIAQGMIVIVSKLSPTEARESLTTLLLGSKSLESQVIWVSEPPHRALPGSPSADSTVKTPGHQASITDH